MTHSARFLLCAALLLGSPLSAAQAQAVTRGGTLQIAVDQSPVGLDPHVATAFSTFVVTGQIYEGLLDIDAKLNIRPLLASKYAKSADGLTYTFTLRPNVKFHNGDTLSADDVVFSMNRVKDPKTASPLASRLSAVKDIKATGPLEVTFTLSQPFAPFLSEVATIAILDKKYVMGGGDVQRKAVGTGPFSLQAWVPDTYVQLARNPNYWAKGQPYLAALKFNIVPDAATRQIGLQSGTYQFLPNIDASLAATLKNAAGVKLLESQDLSYSLLGVNVTRKPFNDPRVREALNYAINRPEIVQGVYFGDAVPAGPIPPAVKQYATPVSNFPCYTYDPAKAKALLAQAGYPNGVDFSILTFNTIKTVSDAAQVLQAELAPAGFRAKIDIKEFGSFVQNWRNSNFDAFVSLNGGSIDPDGQLYRTLISGGSTNVFKYDNPAVDKLLEQGRSATSIGVRVQTYARLQKLIACQGPVAFIAYGTLYSAASDKVNGFTPNPTRSLSAFKTTWLGK